MVLSTEQLNVIKQAENKLFSAKISGATASMWTNDEIEDLLIIIDEMREQQAQPPAPPEVVSDYEWDSERRNWFKKERQTYQTDPRHIKLYNDSGKSIHLASDTNPVMPVCGAKCMWSFTETKGFIYRYCPVCFPESVDAARDGSDGSNQ